MASVSNNSPSIQSSSVKQAKAVDQAKSQTLGKGSSSKQILEMRANLETAQTRLSNLEGRTPPSGNAKRGYANNLKRARADVASLSQQLKGTDLLGAQKSELASIEAQLQTQQPMAGHTGRNKRARLNKQAEGLRSDIAAGGSISKDVMTSSLNALNKSDVSQIRNIRGGDAPQIGGSYEVKSGDTLGGIASKLAKESNIPYADALSAVKDANPDLATRNSPNGKLKGFDYIRSGETINMPTSLSGDGLEKAGAKSTRSAESGKAAHDGAAATQAATAAVAMDKAGTLRQSGSSDSEGLNAAQTKARALIVEAKELNAAGDEKGAFALVDQANAVMDAHKLTGSLEDLKGKTDVNKKEGIFNKGIDTMKGWISGNPKAAGEASQYEGSFAAMRGHANSTDKNRQVANRDGSIVGAENLDRLARANPGFAVLYGKGVSSSIDYKAELGKADLIKTAERALDDNLVDRSEYKDLEGKLNDVQGMQYEADRWGAGAAQLDAQLQFQRSTGRR